VSRRQTRHVLNLFKPLLGVVVSCKVEVIHQIFTTVEGKSIGVSAVNGMLVPLVHFPRNVLLSITLEFIGNPFEFRCEFVLYPTRKRKEICHDDTKNAITHLDCCYFRVNNLWKFLIQTQREMYKFRKVLLKQFDDYLYRVIQVLPPARLTLLRNLRVTFPSCKASNVCNQFSSITSFRAIKLKKMILTKKKVFPCTLIIHN
jgi:hypothetical protein